MGWKNLKEHFNITHLVHVDEKGIQIGGSYVTDLATIDPLTGRVTKSETFKGFLEQYYPSLLAATPEQLLHLIRTPDTFTAAVTVYSAQDGEILESKCEEPGWPNVTHDGVMMYENSHSTNKDVVVEWERNSLKLSIEYGQENIDRLDKELIERHEYLAQARADLAKLEAQYPATAPDYT